MGYQMVTYCYAPLFSSETLALYKSLTYILTNVTNGVSQVTLKGQTRDPNIRLERNISKTAGFRDSVPKDHNRKWHMGYQIIT